MNATRLPEFPQDEKALLKLDAAHKAYMEACRLNDEELQAAEETINRKHSYFILTAQSVLYEAMANAAREGFSNDDMCQVMHGEGH